jgi:hypothetical protein
MSTFTRIREALRNKRAAAAIALQVDLSIARTDWPYNVDGGALLVDRLDGYLQAKINSPNGDAFNLRHSRRIATPFSTIYLTNTAQAGRSARLLVLFDGVDASLEGSVYVVGAYLAPTALGIGGTATVWTPGTGLRIALSRYSISVDAATRISLRWGTTEWESFYLPANGSIGFNLFKAEEPGPKDTALVIYSSAACNATMRASGEEV